MTIVICGFPGIGKTDLFKKLIAEGRIVSDSDSSLFSQAKDDKGENIRNPEFPQNYIEHIKRCINHKFEFVFVSTHKEVIDALIENGIAATIVYPHESLKEDYIVRYKERGSHPAFVNLMEEKWSGFIEDVTNARLHKVILLDKDTYLGTIFDQQHFAHSDNTIRHYATGYTLLSKEDVNDIADMKKQAIDNYMIFGKHNLRIYGEIDKDKVYIISILCSSGTGTDNTAITIVDPDTEKPVADFKSNNKDLHFPINMLSKLVEVLMKELTPNGVICIERNYTGFALIEELSRTEYHNKIYYDIEAEESTPDNPIEGRPLRGRIYGIYHNLNARNVMFKTLEKYVQEHKEKFVTGHITSDLIKFSVAGHRGSNLVSYLMALYILHHGKEVHNFGIERK